MKTSRPIVLVLCLLSAVSLLQAGGTATEVAQDGSVHTIQTESQNNSTNNGGASLVHIFQLGNGSRTRTVIPETEGPGLDSGPTLAMDPVLDAPVLAWSRPGPVDLELRLTRFEDGRWLPSRRLADLPGDDVEVELAVTARYVHAVWKSGADGASYYWAAFDRSGLEPLFAPQTLNQSPASLVPSSGGTSSEPLPRDASFFARPRVPAGSGPTVIIIWAVRDDPVPSVAYEEGLVLPAGLQGVSDPQAGWVGDRFAVWFTAGSGYFYAYRDGGAWTDLRVIKLEDGLGRDAAELKMRDMLQRDASGLQ